MTKKTGKKRKSQFMNRFVSARERDYIIENLSTLIAANVSVIEALHSIKTEIKSPYLRKGMDRMIEAIRNGVPLWRAMDESGMFASSVISLVRIGEQTGRLPENLIVVADRNRKNRSFRSKLQSAMLYPVFVLGLTVVVGTGISWFILPKLATVFGQLRVELPYLTKIIIKLGELLGEHGAIVVPSFLLLVGAIIFFLFVFSKTKHVGQALLLRIPGINRLIKEVEIARFGYLFGTLLSAGIPIQEALESLEMSTSIRRYKKFYRYLAKTLAHGYSVKHAFSDYPRSRSLIPSPIQQVLITGEQSGHLSDMLIDVSVMYEEKIESTTKNVSVLLEPFLLVIVWLGVMGIAIAVILPIYGLLDGIR